MRLSARSQSILINTTALNVCLKYLQNKNCISWIAPAVNGGAWLLFDYYRPRNRKSRFAQCFQCLCESSGICGKLGKNPQGFENAVFYQDTPENSDRRHCSCQALSLCKKARRKLMHLSLRLAFARTDCTPHDTLCTYGAKQLIFRGFWTILI